MEVFAITGVLTLSLICALLAGSAVLQLILFLMVPDKAATRSARRSVVFGDIHHDSGNDSLTASSVLIEPAPS